jgi:SAM-dependent methyltransferase
MIFVWIARDNNPLVYEIQVVGLKLGIPDTHFTTHTFDFVYSTTTLEMVRGIFRVARYRQCLAEIYRILRPGGIFGL